MASLPRINVTARDTAASLSVRLRSGVPAPLPRNVLSLRWVAAGGRCLVGRNGIVVQTAVYALCTVVANGDRWTSYRLKMNVAGRAGSTAILELRASKAGAIEIAVGASTVSVKERIDDTWHSFREVRILPTKAEYAALPRGTKPGPTLIGGGTVQLAITLRATSLSLSIQRSAPRSGVTRLLPPPIRSDSASPWQPRYARA